IKVAGLIPTRSKRMELVDLIEQVEPSVVRINTVTEEGGSLGSGFVADNSGTVITNFHVMEGANKAFAVFADGREVPVKCYRHYDVKRDIAVIQLDLPENTVPAIPIADEL